MPSPDLRDPDLPLSMIFDRWPETAGAFFRRRMLCFGCPIAPFHTLTDACEEYGLDPDAFCDELFEAAQTRCAAREPSGAPEQDKGMRIGDGDVAADATNNAVAFPGGQETADGV